MGRLEPYENKKTSWMGLWYQPGRTYYTSASFSLADLRKFKGNIRFVLRKNKYFEKGTNRPNYVFMLVDASNEKYISPEILDDRTTDEQEERQELEEMREKVEALAEVMREGRRNGDLVALPSDSKDRMNRLFADAYSIIEDLTGEKWEFTCCNWY